MELKSTRYFPFPFANVVLIYYLFTSDVTISLPELMFVHKNIFQGWRRLAKFKEIYYRCVIQLFQGIQAEEQQKMGERVAFYQLAHDTLEEAIKLSKNLDKIEVKHLLLSHYLLEQYHCSFIYYCTFVFFSPHR